MLKNKYDYAVNKDFFLGSLDFVLVKLRHFINYKWVI